MSLKEMLDQKGRMIPGKGFRLVGLDDFETDGSQLYPISIHATREEAEAALRDWESKHTQTSPNQDKAFIYGPDDH